uniref:Uncharacterized protein n=1 Tax=Streptomyces rochei TaxID=1928 RepID=A0A0U3SRD8_STRRO|nr:hypothetical protein [Streptomyces rochei]
MDHRLRSLRQGFVVPCQAAVLHQPAEGSLDHPPLRQGLEPLHPWPLYDLDIDPLGVTAGGDRVGTSFDEHGD